ncbi:hypothetical protein JQC72_08340 [Polycladomyces sp. WAk]|uniref:Helicase C-terminal domain-containing protein n=1 Tax=Polycladomyces zharkentensis TaxID=2807616 RepID=A0ABS2WJ26_9BACL|nr:helicase-related protein [Polycladomyces sp. WAk]MBN2909534.1 hypothetical protein [Polycladomyces sp. WAk]
MRHKIIDFLKRELIGPDPISPFVQSNGEEVLFEPPRQRYGAAILFPQGSVMDDSERLSEKELTSLNEKDEEEYTEEAVDRTNIRFGNDYEGEEEAYDDVVNLSNAYFPSAIGLSCFMELPADGVVVHVHAGRYKTGSFPWRDQNGNEKVRKNAYLRESIDSSIPINVKQLPLRERESRKFPVVYEGKEIGLTVYVTNRSVIKGCHLLTFSLVNEIKGKASIWDSEKCFFQVNMNIESINGEACFLPYPENRYIAHEDDEVNKLLYRNHKSYAIGHGCAAHWDLEEGKKGRVKRVETSILPFYEMKPILPVRLEDVELSMLDLSDLSNNYEKGVSNLEQLCSKYEKWIKKQEKQIPLLITDLQDIAKKQVNNCYRCLNRMREGIQLVKSDEKVMQAFQLMNKAMLIQQLRYSLPTRNWNENEIIQFKDIDVLNRKTWPKQHLGNWRPFQIAFILMNLKSITDPNCSDRNMVDIIWFPTGGGKTEAYLGLTAFSIFMRRLKNPEDSGTSVLMRYTLRLLTAQQFQRAAALITACERIREEKPDLLGNDRITIGLWVGGGLSPNTRQEAKSAYSALERNGTQENPFVLLKCPWCGAQMGPVSRKGKSKKSEIKIVGYKKTRETVVFQCGDKKCHFSGKALPVLIVDEDMYMEPPSLVIATVDKFAMLPWKPEARAFFGFRDNGKNVSPPDLIIQDELHLISGPLGSMAGHYETLVAALCKNSETGRGPKIIASTATISRAKEQVHALYNCGQDNVFLFPPQCLEAGESFFAYVEHDTAKVPGRIYVGVHASGLPSHATAQVRVISALSQAVKMLEADDKEKDPYWTIVNYFNSLRELGHAATLVSADINEYIRSMWIRKNVLGDSNKKRIILKTIELTSRVKSSEIPQYLQELEYSYPGYEEHKPVDICLATNMISVGMDIPRLGLMTVIGQPKTTSEYIQATSRVGRSQDAPGLVVVIYNTQKPRDRSQYEQFYSYHDKIYSHVEPTSVTPFAAPVRERALHAVITGIVRFLGSENYLKGPYPPPDEKTKQFVLKTIQERVEQIDLSELEDTIKMLEKRFSEWERYQPLEYGNPMGSTLNQPLMYPFGMKPDMKLRRAWPTPTSMRNVDVECKVEVISNYPEGDEQIE